MSLSQTPIAFTDIDAAERATDAILQAMADIAGRRKLIEGAPVHAEDVVNALLADLGTLADGYKAKLATLFDPQTPQIKLPLDADAFVYFFRDQISAQILTMASIDPASVDGSMTRDRRMTGLQQLRVEEVGVLGQLDQVMLGLVEYREALRRRRHDAQHQRQRNQVVDCERDLRDLDATISRLRIARDRPVSGLLTAVPPSTATA